MIAKVEKSHDGVLRTLAKQDDGSYEISIRHKGRLLEAVEPTIDSAIAKLDELYTEITAY